MKNFKFIYLLLVAVGALAFTACDKHDWTPGEPDANQGVFFPSTVATSYEVAKTDSSVTLPVHRSNKGEASSVAIRYDDPSKLFTIPSSVDFAAGESEGEFVISFDGDKLVPGTAYSIALQISSDNASMYGYSELTIKIGVPEPWVDLGQGIYLDDFLRNLLEDVPAGLGAYVPVQQHAENENRIRIVNPFSMDVVGYMWGGVPGFFVWEEGVDTFFEFDVTDPNNVLLAGTPAVPIGVSANFGTDGILPLYLYVVEGAPITFAEGIIRFAKDGIYLAYPWEGDFQGWAANAEGMTMYLMPGVELVDYTLVAEYAGMYVTADNSTAAAILNFTVGADLDSYKFVVVPGSADVEAVAAAIVDGTAENVVSAAASETVFEVALATGTYTVVAVGYVADEAVATSSMFFYFPGVGAGEAPEAGIEIIVDKLENLLTEEKWAQVGADYPEEYFFGIELVFEDKSEISAARFYLDDAAAVDAAIAAGKVASKEVIVDTYGNDVFKWVSESDGSTIRVMNVAPGTKYCVILAFDTVYGSTQYYRYDYQMPAYTAGFAVGQYTITEGETTTAFNVTPALDANTVFVEFADFLGFQFYAAWDKTANTISLDGYAYGYEAYESLFDMTLINNGDNSYKCLTSAADAEFKTGSDIIISLADNAPSKLNTYLKAYRVVANADNTVAYDSDYYTLTPAAVFAPAAAKASVVVKNVELKSMNVSSESIDVEKASKVISIEKFEGAFERQFTMTSKSAVFFN